MCPILKKLSNKLEPFHEAYRIINEILATKKGNEIRVLEHLLSYAEYQFGEKVNGVLYRERDGERINSWNIDLEIYYGINARMVDFYTSDRSLGLIKKSEKISLYLERSPRYINPWLIHLDSDGSDGISGLSEEEKNHLLQMLFTTESNLCKLTEERRQFDVAEGHCQRCLAYAKRLGIEGEFKTNMILEALTSCGDLRQRQDDFSSAVKYAEEAYNLVVEAYNPVHPQVQDAAGVLIQILIANDNLYDAQRFAEITYSNLRDKKNGMDQESEAVAMGAYNLAHVIYQQEGDRVKAEKLAREAIRIRTSIYGINSHTIGVSCDLLARIMREQNDLGDETRKLFERSLAIFNKDEGEDGLGVAAVNNNLGKFYHMLAGTQPTIDSKRTQLQLSKSYYEQALRIYWKICGPEHSYTLLGGNRLMIVMRELGIEV